MPQLEHISIKSMGEAAQAAARQMTQLSTAQRNAILLAMAAALEAQTHAILLANAQDLAAARQAALSEAMLDRLTLTPARVQAMADGIRQVAALDDPVNRVLWQRTRPNGLVIEKRSVPLGVVAIIYEARPNVTADAAVLCLKSANSVILRGGKEARHSNRAIATALSAGGRSAGLPENALQLVATTDRSAVRELVQLDGLVDVVIPRGGESLIRAVVEHAWVPVLKHYKGVCHIYVDAQVNHDQALRIVENAKCQRPGVCNALETLLVHQASAPTFLPRLADMAQRSRVELRGCATTCELIPTCHRATAEDWSAEYLDLCLAVRVVPDLTAAIAHINAYGSHHSDAILTTNQENAQFFVRAVDSAAVYVNASTRFTDGGEFGMGAEMGISTDKLHARGPMGLDELTTYKYVVMGEGQIR